MKNVFIPFDDYNTKLLVAGKKTTTVRSERSAASIGLNKNETGLFKTQDGTVFTVSCLGFLTIHEAPGGRDGMWISEGFVERGEPKFKQTSDWLSGHGRLWVYLLTKVG
jgi:hypothetical protein